MNISAGFLETLGRLLGNRGLFYGLMGLEKEVDTALKRFSNQTDQWRRWADISLTENNFADIIEAMKFCTKAMAMIDSGPYTTKSMVVRCLQKAFFIRGGEITGFDKPGFIGILSMYL